MLFSKKTYSNPLFAKFKDWSKLLGATGGAQILVQAIGFISGILIIRILPTDEYAIYTLANTMLGTMVILSDGGISAGVLSQSAGVWQDKKKLGQVLNTGFDLRKKFAIASLLVSVPILLYLLRNIDVNWYVAIIVVIALIPAFISKLSFSLLVSPAKVRQDILPLQKNDLEINFTRIALLLASIFVFPFAFVAILVAGISQIWGNYRLRKVIKPYVDFTQEQSAEVKKNILKIVYRTLPESIYYCISGQITIWILAVFGSTSSLAEIGALSRIALLLSLITVMFKTLIVPRYARLKNDFNLIFKRFVTIQFLLLLVFSVFLLAVFLFSDQILWILGPKYSNFNKEILLVMLGSSLNLFSGLTFSTCVSRGWVINPLISIPLSIFTMICCVMVFDVSTLYGVLLFNIVIALVHAIMNSTYGFIKVFKLKEIS
ncbi:polysaccharide biosynthesis protein [uncultured Algibacter sp.]|uniref:polysaccharide biosynthesis protein n=1 Tax=uncultured Algibacter sp. TaxID=298659 RepID=UPI0032179B60